MPLPVGAGGCINIDLEGPHNLHSSGSQGNVDSDFAMCKPSPARATAKVSSPTIVFVQQSFFSFFYMDQMIWGKLICLAIHTGSCVLLGFYVLGPSLPLYNAINDLASILQFVHQ